MNLFRDPRPAGCHCPDLLDTVRATLEDKQPARCAVHDGDPADEARRTGLERLIAENRAAAAAAEREANPPPSLGEVVGRLLAGDADRLAPVVALNASADTWAARLGMTTNDNRPPDAA